MTTTDGASIPKRTAAWDGGPSAARILTAIPCRTSAEA
jgi:hypothetical protein